MKRLLLLLSLFSVTELFATINSSSYTMSSSTSTSLITANGTRTKRLDAENSSGVSSVLSLPFTFTFEGASYSQFSISSDGWIKLGSSSASSQSSNDLSSTSNIPKIAPFWDDLTFASENSGGGVYTFVNGSSPNRVFVIEWVIKANNGSSSNAKVQLALYETSNNFSFIYNGLNPSSTIYSSYSVGFSNKTSSSTNNQASMTISTSSGLTSGSISYSSVNNSNTAKIANGTAFTFTTAGFSISSNLAFANFTTTSMDVNFTGGSGSNHLVLCKSASSISTMPTNNTSYTASTTFGSGSSIGGAYVVYNGTGSSFSLSGLTANTNYNFAVIEQTGTGSSATFYTTSVLYGDHGTLAPPPSTPPSTASYGTTSATALTFTVAKGNGSRRMVVCQKDNDFVNNCENGHSYTHNSRYGDGDAFENGYVVYDGEDNTFSVSGLDGGSKYKFMVIEYNGTGTSSTYDNDHKYRTENTTNATPPTNPASTAVYGTTKSDEISFSFSGGNGTKRIVVCKKGSEITSNARDGKVYAADSSFGSGDTFGDGGYVIYNGTGTSCKVKHLDDNSTYHFCVIEYNGDNDKCSYDNDHKYKTHSNTSLSDRDNDGVADIDDNYPDDDKRAYATNYPSAGFGTLMFEDLWPGKGDYDFNDLVVDYRFTTVSNASNNVVEVNYTFVTRAVGGSLENGFAFQLDNINPNKITSITGSKAAGASWIHTNSNGTETGHSTHANVLVYDNAYELFPSTGGSYVNTVATAPDKGTDTTRMTVVFISNGVAPSGGTVSTTDFTSSVFNPYLIVGQDRGKEVHLANRIPTAKVNNAYFGQESDRTNAGQNKYYVTSNNLPWGLNIVTSIPFAKEKQDFSTAYLKFIDWATSGGSSFSDWYINNTGYRNTSNLIIR